MFTVHVQYIASDANTRESLAEFESLCEPEPVGLHISTFKLDQTLSSVCIRLYINTGRPFSFSFIK